MKCVEVRCTEVEDCVNAQHVNAQGEFEFLSKVSPHAPSSHRWFDSSTKLTETCIISIDKLNNPALCFESIMTIGPTMG